MGAELFTTLQDQNNLGADWECVTIGNRFTTSQLDLCDPTNDTDCITEDLCTA